MSGSIKIGGQFPAPPVGVQTLVAGGNITITNSAGPTSTIAVAPLAANSLFGNAQPVPANAGAIAVDATNLSLTSDGTLQIATGPIIKVTPTSPMVLNANTAFVAGPSGNLFHLVGADGSVSNFTFDTYGAQPQSLGRRAQGTQAAPTAVAANTNLMAYGATGYGATGFATAARAQIVMQSSEAWTDTAQGTQMNFNVSLNGGTVAATALRLANTGDLIVGSITDVANGGKLQVRGGSLLDLITLGTIATGPQILQTAIVPTGTFAVSTLLIRTNGSVGAGLYFANAGGSAVAIAGV